MKLTKTKLKQIIKEEFSALAEEEVGRKYADMSQEELLDTIKSTTYQKVYLFAKGELKKRGYGSEKGEEFPERPSKKKKDKE